MGKQVSAKDLDLDDGYDDEEEGSSLEAEAPEYDSDSTPAFKGGPWGGESPGEIGAEAVEKEVEAKKAQQKKAEDEALAERKAKDEEEEKPETYADDKAMQKAIKEGKRKISEQATQLKKLQAMNAELEKKIAEAGKASDTAIPPGENPYAKRRDEIHAQAIAKAAAIKAPVAPQDREDPEFDKKWEEYTKAMEQYNSNVTKVWGQAMQEISDVTYEEKEQAKADKQTVLNAVDSALEAVKFADGTTLADIDNIHRIFWGFSADVPKNIPMEDQIKRTIALCKAHVESIRGKERRRAQQDKEEKESLDVMGRGSRVTTKKQPETPMSMKDAQKAALESRRLRHNP